MTSAEIIGTTITPVVVVNAIGLLGLVMQNRYGRVKDRIYRLLRERDSINGDSPEITTMLDNKKTLLKKYLVEAKLIKNSMLYAFLSISFIVITCIFIMATNYFFSSSDSQTQQYFIYVLLEGLILLTFLCGLFLLMMCVLSMSRSLMISIATVSFEISTEHID
ncbi:MAG: DUF2721 domain-containing protein [Candidatus Hodarchaeales archaeon]